MSDMKVTGEQVKEATLKAGIRRVDHHGCSGCGYMTAYLIDDNDQLYFDPGCYCRSYGPVSPEPREWSSVADWINMQSRTEHRDRIAQDFGLAALGIEAPTAAPKNTGGER